jgi:hypothetical protein
LALRYGGGRLLAATATGRRLTVVNARGIVRRVLDITGTFPTLAGEDPFEPERA